MKFWQGVSFTEPEQLVEIAAGAERAGFEGVLVSEHLFVPETYAAGYPYSQSGRPDFDADTPFPDPWVAITAMAAATRRLRFATMVSVLPLHHPLEIAKAVGTAALFSDNRVVLGAGAGWMREEFEALGVDFATRGRRFDESIAVLRRMWTGEMVEYRGEIFDFGRIQMRPAPTKTVPIYIGGASKPALQRAASLGDGWLGAGNTPEQAAAILKDLARLRRDAGRESEPFEAVVPLLAPPDADTLRRLSDLGATGTVNYPFRYTLAPEASLAEKLDMMKRFGDEMIGPLQDL
ncbi:MAG: LLM class F420-dependent oxidoreductase [Myxococcota bacterium]